MEKKKLTKKQAEKLVQQKLADAQKILGEAGAIMDEHGFTVQFMDLDYMVRHDYKHEEAVDGANPFGFYFEIDDDADYEKYFAGKWLPSSNWRGC